MLRRTSILGSLLLASGVGMAGEGALDPALVAGRRWADGAARYATELLDLAAAPKLPEARDLADLVGKQALCQLLANAELRFWGTDPEDEEVLGWLQANPTLAHTLALAVRPEDDPARALTAFGVTLPAGKPRKLNAPDLYVAFAVVWDSRLAPRRPPAPRGDLPGQVERAAEVEPLVRLRALFGHYALNAGRLRVDITRLPWPLLTWLADTTVAPDEQAWAIGRYAGRDAYRVLYDAVPFEPHRMAWARGVRYTLDNVLAHGGASPDRAYFAAQVGKVCGSPCFVLAGQSRLGVEHAWVVELTTGTSNGKFAWATQGPLEEPLGSYVDPQTNQARTLSDARLLARSLSQPAAWRTTDTYYHVAERCGTRLPITRTLAFLEQAARTNPYDPRPWLMLSRLMGAKAAAPEKAGALYRFLLAKFKNYPEFTRDILHALLPLLPEDDIERRRQLYEATFEVYRANPDIATGLMTELAGYLQSRGQTAAALATYRALIKRYREQGHLVEGALQAAEALYRQRKMLPQAIEMYEEVYQTYREREKDAVVHGQGAFVYRFAAKLAELYREAGDPAHAAEYARRCERLQRESEERARRERPREGK